MTVVVVEDFSKVDDPVKTEEIISEQLIRKAESIDSDYVYVSFPLAWNINKNGLRYTQNRIDTICRNLAGLKLFFICQHILVNRLNFQGNLVFTPHATFSDSFMPLPHHSCTYDLDFVKPWDEREYVFSFMGSFITHPVRRKLYDYFSNREDCLMIDTGSWHFEGSKEKQEANTRKYIELLGNTKYSLCPRGSGPSTIRIWESMAMGSTPVILSGFLKMPLEMQTPAGSWITAPENFTDLYKPEVEKKYNNKDYWDLFSNENLYKAVTSVL